MPPLVASPRAAVSVCGSHVLLLSAVAVAAASIMRHARGRARAPKRTAPQVRGSRACAVSGRTRGGRRRRGAAVGPAARKARQRERGWCGCSGRGRGPMPPSCPGAVSGVWRTAQRTIRNRATIGIFSRTISQMKVQASTLDRSYTRCRIRTSPRCGRCRRPDGASAEQLQRGAAELGHRVQFVDPRDDLAPLQPLDPRRCRTPRR